MVFHEVEPRVEAWLKAWFAGLAPEFQPAEKEGVSQGAAAD
jgi:hypothetical protein